jgi:hypothetical protein
MIIDNKNKLYSPVEIEKSVFCGMHDVLWLIMLLNHVLSKNQMGATLVPLGNNFYRPKTKWPPGPRATNLKFIITSLILVLWSWSWCLNICFKGQQSQCNTYYMFKIIRKKKFFHLIKIYLRKYMTFIRQSHTGVWNWYFV